MFRVKGSTMLDRVIAMDHFSEKDSATAMLDVLHAVQYLHEIELVHRDLKVDFHMLELFTASELHLDAESDLGQLENLMYASDNPASPDYHTIKVGPLPADCAAKFNPWTMISYY
jgi:serine/threonine protein kinase